VRRGGSSGGSDTYQQASAAAPAAPGLTATAAAAAIDAYSASLPTLQGLGGRQPMQALMAGVGAGLPLESISEHYQRALLFLERHGGELSSEQLGVLEVRCVPLAYPAAVLLLATAGVLCC
jgi:hypothetical protein